MNTNDGGADQAAAAEGMRWVPEHELNGDHSFLIFRLTHPDSDGTIEVWSLEEAAEAILRRVRDLKAGKPGRVEVELMFFYRVSQPDDADVLGWDGSFGTATIAQVESGAGPLTELHVDPSEVASFLGWALKERSAEVFELLRLLCLLAAPSFERFADDLPDLLKTAGRVIKATARIARNHSNPPRIPIDDEEFLERLGRPNEVVWGVELKQFLGLKKWSNLKEHLIRASFITGDRDLHSYRTTTSEIMSRFVPYAQNMHPQHDIFYRFLEKLEEAELIPRPDIPRPR